MARHNFTLRLSEAERAYLKAEAEAQGRSVNDVLRRRLFPEPISEADARADLAGIRRPDRTRQTDAPTELEVRDAANKIGQAGMAAVDRHIITGQPAATDKTKTKTKTPVKDTRTWIPASEKKFGPPDE